MAAITVVVAVAAEVDVEGTMHHEATRSEGSQEKLEAIVGSAGNHHDSARRWLEY